MSPFHSDRREIGEFLLTNSVKKGKINRKKSKFVPRKGCFFKAFRLKIGMRIREFEGNNLVSLKG